jgi:hypothetical protein
MIKVYRTFIISECIVTGDNYFDKLENWLMPQLQEHLDKVLVFQQDEVPPNVHYADFLDRTLSESQIYFTTDCQSASLSWNKAPI